ncbi:hypothetical protein Skr01_13740 [Sphaerisporangium krabiense]|uniref:Putative lipoprotein with Yx(FWY)xxD motif n=1 Tax=Sphaerisporangium krabiense TaxID=763782 RepID=A0A7W8Z074_9ACTN|nr:hypothetical protein [Sphaerisporangium krabiense]MBB5624750.1 putative lipoprotein with Yx(FWY)xxD motif [Sphaerisporangium krabiense]GII61289.1 hypothetical protein Skr01_13740 [Sphaerisporangium krabiense]
MDRILASSIGLATTVLLVSACGGSTTPNANYSRAAANATESPTPTGTETGYPGTSPTASPTGTASPGGSPTASPGVSPTESASPMPTPEHAKVRVADSRYGKVLVGENGRALYVFDKDTDNTSNCNDACATAWPPLVTRDKPRAGEGVKESLLGTTTRKQGEKQVTYNKHPLYYFSGDKVSGDFNGQGKTGFGGKWHLIDPEGKKVEK